MRLLESRGIFAGLGDETNVWMSHGDHVERLPPGWRAIARSPTGAVRALGARATILAGARFDSANGEAALKRLYGVATLDAFGAFGRAELAAAGAVADYIAVTQKGRAARLTPLRAETESAVVQIDPATRRNLEISETLAGGREGALLAAIDRTVTAAGARALSP